MEPYFAEVLNLGSAGYELKAFYFQNTIELILTYIKNIQNT